MGKIYRGLRLNNLPQELLDHVRRYTRMPYDESEVGQHLKIGPVLLDHIENNHHDPDLSLGQNWTTNRDFAGKAGCSQTGPCQLGVVLEADIPTDENSFDPTNRGNHPGMMQSEQQVTILPDVPLNITGLKLVGRGNGGRSGNDLEVLHDPHYIDRMAEFGLSYIGGPQVRIAMAESISQRVDRHFFAYGFGGRDSYDFTGSPETQYHHRSITPETVKGIDKREDNIDIYYEEMHQRKEQGLEPIPWNEWLSRVAYIRNIAMPLNHIPPMNHFDDRLFKKQLDNLGYWSDEDINGRPDRVNLIRSQGGSTINTAGEHAVFMSFIHHDENGAPNGILHYFPTGSRSAKEKPGGIQVLVHPDHQGKGIGSKLLEAAMSEYGPEAEGFDDYVPIDLDNQNVTPGGNALIQQYLKRNAMAWGEF